MLNVPKLTIIQHTPTTQLYFIDRFSLFDQCYENQWKRVGTNTPISPTEPMLKLSLFFLPFSQSQQSLTKYAFFLKVQNCHLVSLIVLVPQWMLKWSKRVSLRSVNSTNYPTSHHPQLSIFFYMSTNFMHHQTLQYTKDTKSNTHNIYTS